MLKFKVCAYILNNWFILYSLSALILKFMITFALVFTCFLYPHHLLICEKCSACAQRSFNSIQSDYPFWDKDKSNPWSVRELSSVNASISQGWFVSGSTRYFPAGSSAILTDGVVGFQEICWTVHYQASYVARDSSFSFILF